MSDRDKSEKSSSRRRRGLFGSPDDSLMQGLTPMPRKKKRRPPTIVPALPSPDLTGPLPALEGGTAPTPDEDVLEVEGEEPPGFVPVTVPQTDHSGFTEPAYGMFEDEFDTLPAGGRHSDPEMDTEMAIPPSDEVYEFVDDDSEEHDEDDMTEDSSVEFVPKPGRRVAAPKLQVRIPPPERRAEGLGSSYGKEGWESHKGAEDNVSVFEEHSDDSLFNLVAGRHDEDFEDPHSDVIEFGPLPRGRVVVKGEDGFSNEERSSRGDEDAEVWKDERERAMPSRRTSAPRAWWETEPAQGPELPEKKRMWETPEKAPDFRGATRDDKERASTRGLARSLLVVLVFVIIGAIAFSKYEPESTERAPEAVTDVDATSAEETEAAEQPTDDAVEDPEVVEEPAVVEPEVIEEPPEPVVEKAPEPAVEKAPEPEAPSIAATAETEEAARQAIYETGVLVVRSEPRALIYVDGRRRGYTPLEGLQLQPGNHLVKAVVPGRAPKYSQVRVDPGGAHVVPFTF